MALADGAHWNELWRLGREGTPIVPHPRQPVFHWYYWIPAVLIALFSLLLNVVQLRGIVGDDTEGRTTVKKAYVFIMITAAICCLGGSTYISSVHLGEALPPIHGINNIPNEEEFVAWPGMSLVVNAFGQICAAILFFGARRPPGSGTF